LSEAPEGDIDEINPHWERFREWAHKNGVGRECGCRPLHTGKNPSDIREKLLKIVAHAQLSVQMLTDRFCLIETLPAG
jgi:hypothetical protein